MMSGDQVKANFLYTSLINKYNAEHIQSFLRALESSGNLQAFELLYGTGDIGRDLTAFDNNKVSLQGNIEPLTTL